MKPRIKSMGSTKWWYCDGLGRIGMGRTPSAAYFDWRRRVDYEKHRKNLV